MNTTHFLRAVIAILSLAVAIPATAQNCTGDIAANGIVDGADIGVLLSYWGARTQDPFSIAADLNGDSLINGGDLGLVLSNWGPCQSAITGITPNQVCVIGGTLVTITGTNLGTTSSVSFGGTQATSFTVMNGSTLTALTPTRELGPATVRLTTAAGTITAPQAFTYLPPSVSAIEPNSGLTIGGTRVTITGAFLGTTSSVSVGGIPATELTVVSASTVTVRTPPGVAGQADLVITGAKGVLEVPGAFNYVPFVVPSWATLVETTPDPLVVFDPNIRAAILATGYAWRVRDSATQIEMVLAPHGTFSMGCSSSAMYGCFVPEFPVHQVTLTRPFYVSRYEVTQAQWSARMGANPSGFQGPNFPDSANRPVENVSWNDVQSFAGPLGMRLLTEAEWEYAYRGGTTSAFHGSASYPSGTPDYLLGDIAWYGSCCNGNSAGQTHVVGQRASNGFGLYDMAGNVFEWVNDWQGQYSAQSQVDPVGPSSGSERVVRGGAYGDSGDKNKCSFRSYGGSPDGRGTNTGFRVARNP
jgi:formylglycine-generating enzyme required for sulfatase activity